MQSNACLLFCKLYLIPGISRNEATAEALNLMDDCPHCSCKAFQVSISSLAFLPLHLAGIVPAKEAEVIITQIMKGLFE